MNIKPVTLSASEIIVEQLAALGVKYVFNNSGSREAAFFDALHSNSNVHGILSLHEGSVAAMAGGYTQANLDPAVMVVHLGAGLAQCMGQLINVWTGSLPVVVITFAGDTGSFVDRIGLDLNHNFGPTSISAPFTKANWTVIEPEGIPQAIERALRVAQTPPTGPVHLAIYDRMLTDAQVTTNIIQRGNNDIKAGYPSSKDVEDIVRALKDAKRPLLYVGDGIWKSGAETQIIALAEHFGIPVVGDIRSVPIKHPLHCGRIDQYLKNNALNAINPDQIICVGVRHNGSGSSADFKMFYDAERVIAIGPDVENLKNIPGLDLAILADERRTIEQVTELALTDSTPSTYGERRAWAREEAASLRAQRRQGAQIAPHDQSVRPWVLADALDNALEDIGGGLISYEQFAVPIDILGNSDGPGNNVYIRPAGGSEGYGIGAAIGVKLAAPDKPVVGLVGDGSLYYSDSGLWTAAHHGIPLLYVIPNNGAYGVVASSFGQAGGNMKQSGEYAGVVLDKIDPVKIAEGFGVEGRHVNDESQIAEAIENGLKLVETERRPLLLDVRLPLGVPQGGHAAKPFNLKDSLTDDH